MNQATLLATKAGQELKKPETPLYGLMAEFDDHELLLAAAHRAYERGYRKMDAFSPFPVEGLAEALGSDTTLVPMITLVGGMLGGLGGYFMEWYSMSRLYPLNVGGRPLNSWPSFIPITFELTVLVASISAFLSVFVLNRLPQLHHPLFNSPHFTRASIDRFFLCIETSDRRFSREETWEFLETLGSKRVTEVRE